MTKTTFLKILRSFLLALLFFGLCLSALIGLEIKAGNALILSAAGAIIYFNLMVRYGE